MIGKIALVAAVASEGLAFYTVAEWDNGQIVEENLMYDLVTFMKQIGLSK